MDGLLIIPITLKLDSAFAKNTGKEMLDLATVLFQQDLDEFLGKNAKLGRDPDVNPRVGGSLAGNELRNGASQISESILLQILRCHQIGELRCDNK